MSFLRRLTSLAIVLLGLVAFTPLDAAPIAIGDHSFEGNALAAGGWANDLAPEWNESGGPGAGAGFEEFIVGFSADGTDHVGMNSGHAVWQDLGETYQANTVYTLTVAAGHRPGPTNSGNATTYSLRDSSGAVFATAFYDAFTNVPSGTFADAPDLTFDTSVNPAAVGQTIRVQLEGVGPGRSHFDNIRLDAVSTLPPGTATVVNNPATVITNSSARLNGQVTDIGDAAPAVTIFYGDEDGGFVPGGWDASMSLGGTQSGAFFTTVAGLSPATLYYYTARATNSAGESWATTVGTFETAPAPPSVSNIAATNIGATVADVGADVTDDGGDLPDVTVYYGPADGGTNAGAWASSVALGSFSGSMSTTLTGLAQGSTYFFRAFASNDGGSAWASSSTTFSTTVVTAPSLDNDPATGITGTSATLRGDVTDTGGDPPSVTLYFGTTDGGSSPGSWDQSVALGARSGNFSQFVSGLLPETTYYFNARGVNAAGTAWASPSQIFTTGALVPNTVVINEVHYNPADNTSAEEFVELHNPGDTAISIAGWRLNRGVDYTFPNGTEIAAGGYLVVAEDPAVMQSVFNVTALGPYSGGLSGAGEDIELEDATGARVDIVNYGTGFPWPTASDGGGSSMELISPGLDNDIGGSWRASGTMAVPPTPQTFIAPGESGWSYRRTTSEASNPITAWRQIGFSEDASWETGTTVIGYGDGDDTTVITGMQSVHWGLYLRKTFTVDPLEIPSQLALRIYVDDGCIVWLNGTEIGRFHVTAGEKAFDDGGQNHEAEWEELIVNNAGAILGGGTNVLAIHAMNSSFGSSDFSIDAELRTPTGGNVSGVPTPGAPNSVFANNAPPQIRQLDHTPAQPTSADAVAITAKLTDVDGMGPVVLSYQLVEPGAFVRKTDPGYETGWVDVPMVDDGTAGDALAGDSIYTVTMPASLQTHRRLVRYRIAFEDALGNADTAPYEDDEQPNFAYFVYDGVPAWTGADRPGVTTPETFPSTLMDDMPIYHLVANSSDVTNSQYSSGSDGVHMQGAMVYDGKVYDHIEFENRGEASTYQSGKNKWRFHFNRARDFEARDQWGRRYASPWDEMNFDSCASPWAPVHRGMAGLDEAISYRLFALCGMASPRLHYVHFRVVDGAEAPSDQYSGDLWGLYTAIEHPDGSFLDDRGLADGNVYKIEGSGGDKKHQGSTQPTDSSDWNTFRGSSGSTQNEAYWRANMDMEAYYTFRACNRILGNVDVREGFNHYFYHNPNGLWTVMPWDCDMMFIAQTHWSGTIQQKACLNVPVLSLEYKNRCRELLDLVCSDASDGGGQIGQLIDEYADIVNPPGQAQTWSDIDRFMWNFHPRTRGSVGSTSGQGNHKGNFFASPYTDSRRGGNWTRTLASEDHEGSVEYLRNYTTDTFTGGSWTLGNGQQNGYGYEFLAQEASDNAIPATPTITYTGAGFGTDELTFQSSAFSDPQGAGTFGAIRWRIAEISNPSTPGYVPGEPRIYEVETVWQSDEIAPFASIGTIPPSVVRVGNTYRVRAQHKDSSGRWSHWSAPIEFVTTQPDLTPWVDHLMVSEIMYNPDDATPAELAAGYSTGDFEFIELLNISSSLTLDLTELRFTKGVDFDFVGGAVTSLAPGGYVLVVRHQAAFESRYGAGLPVAGEFSPDSLSNGGEQLKLSFGAGSAIRDFVYDDKSPWPTDPDGGGFSLTLISPETAPPHGLATSWRSSAQAGGSPGAGDATTFSGVADADDDGDGYSALLEYALGTSDLDPASGRDAVLIGFQDIAIGASTDTYLALSYQKNIGADDVDYFVEVATDLEGWTTMDTIYVQESHNGDGTSTVTYRLVAPYDQSQPRQFMRVRVEQ